MSKIAYTKIKDFDTLIVIFFVNIIKNIERNGKFITNKTTTGYKIWKRIGNIQSSLEY